MNGLINKVDVYKFGALDMIWECVHPISIHDTIDFATGGVMKTQGGVGFSLVVCGGLYQRSIFGSKNCLDLLLASK